MSDRPTVTRHIAFGAALMAGFAMATFIYLFLAMGECLPRDDSAQMLACDAIKRRDFWLFPTLWLITLACGIYRHVRMQGGAAMLALGSAILAWIALGLINAFV